MFGVQVVSLLNP